MKKHTVETIEMEIAAIENQMKGMDRMSAAYFNLEAQLEQLFYKLDDLNIQEAAADPEPVFVDAAGVEQFLYNVTFITPEKKVECKQVLAYTARGAEHQARTRYSVLEMGKTTKKGGDAV